jgi:hypothetical protein
MVIESAGTNDAESLARKPSNNDIGRWDAFRRYFPDICRENMGTKISAICSARSGFHIVGPHDVEPGLPESEILSTAPGEKTHHFQTAHVTLWQGCK